MIYRGRTIDVLSLWGEVLDLPSNIGDPLPTFLPKTKCPNPDHDTHKHHFQVNTCKPWVHCFAECGISGHYEHALAIIHGLYDKHKVDKAKDPTEREERAQNARREARRLILAHARIAVKGAAGATSSARGTRKSLSAESEVAKDERAIRSGDYSFLPAVARKYLALRGIDDSARGKWEIGWDEATERLVIPAYDENGTFRFLIRREVLRHTSMKYHYTDGALKTSILFGACYLDSAVVESQGLVVCEGPLDVIHLHSIGITNAVAILGTGISRAQVRLIDKINPRRVYLLFDKDSSGLYNVMVAWRGKEGRHHGLAKYPLRVCRYPSGKDDPAELSRGEVERVLERAVTPLKFMQLARKAGLALTTTGGS